MVYVRQTHPLDGLDGVLDLEEVAVGGEDRDGAVVPVAMV
jgi:hypothetical protein